MSYTELRKAAERYDNRIYATPVGVELEIGTYGLPPKVVARVGHDWKGQEKVPFSRLVFIDKSGREKEIASTKGERLDLSEEELGEFLAGWIIVLNK